MNRLFFLSVAVLGCVVARADDAKPLPNSASETAEQSPKQELVLPKETAPAAAPETKAAVPAPVSSAPLTSQVNKSPIGLTEVTLNDSASPLDVLVKKWRCDAEDIPSAAKLLGHAYGVTITVDPDVSGVTTFESSNCTVRDVLTQMTQPAGCFFEEHGGYISVKKYRTVLYVIEYPQLQRSSSEQSTVTLSGGTNNSSTGANGTSGNFVSNGTNGSGSGGSGGSQNDQTSLSISTDNKSDLWAVIGDQLKANLQKDETFFVNKFSGIVQVRATPARHEEIKGFIDKLNEIINSEVEINVQILEVALNDQQKLGVDWSQVSTKIGGVSLAGSTHTAITTVGATTLTPSTFTATLATGKLTSMIDALKAQGNVSSSSNPKIKTLNNQAGYITVGQEETFQFIDSTFDQTTATTTNPLSTTQQHKQRDKYTFGVVLKAIPYVRQDRSVTIDLTGSISKLVSIKTETDGSTTPITDVKRLNSLIRLRAGETAIIGGMIQSSKSEQTNSTPLLGDIPFIGRAFKTEAKVKTRSELVVIVQANVRSN